MKKEERLHRLFGDIDDDLVADAANRPIPVKVWLPRVAAAVAAVALTVGILLTQPWMSEKPPVTTDENGGDGNSTTTTTQQGALDINPGAPIDTAPAIQDPTHVAPPKPTAGTPTTTAERTPDIWYEPKWEDKPIWVKFPNFERFEKGNYVVHDINVDVSLVGEYLQDVNLHGYDVYTETGYDVVGKIYRIKGINDFAAVALQYPDRSDYFPAVCSKYTPATLGELITDLNLRENLRVGIVYYSYHDENGRIHDMQYDGLTIEKVWELLMSDTTPPNVADQSIEWKQKLAIRIDMPLLGYQNISISLSVDGYMRFYLLSTETIFHIGKDKVDAFMAYVEENCRLQKDDELIPMPDDTNAVSGTTMTSPAQPPLETGTTKHEF